MKDGSDIQIYRYDPWKLVNIVRKIYTKTWTNKEYTIEGYALAELPRFNFSSTQAWVEMQLIAGL